MDMRVKTAGCDNFPLGGDDVGISADDEVRINSIHHIWVSGLANADDQAVLDTDVCFVNSSPVHNQGICDERVHCVFV